MQHIITQFIAAINAHEINSIGALMSDEHTFIDAHNNKVTGRENMLAAWKGYFDLFPDYKIEVDRTFADGNSFALFGFAGGTFNVSEGDISMAHWRLPASWKVEVNENKIAVWQVYADAKIPFDIINRFSEIAAAPEGITGLGGVFFKSDDPERLCAWYDKHLGTGFGQNGYSLFRWRERDNRERTGTTTFAVFKSSSGYFSPALSPFMFNFRVNDLDGLLIRLKQEGVEVMEKTETFEYGKFGWIIDPDGNKIELWQPQNEELFG